MRGSAALHRGAFKGNRGLVNFKPPLVNFTPPRQFPLAPLQQPPGLLPAGCTGISRGVRMPSPLHLP